MFKSGDLVKLSESATFVPEENLKGQELKVLDDPSRARPYWMRVECPEGKTYLVKGIECEGVE